MQRHSLQSTHTSCNRNPAWYPASWLDLVGTNKMQSRSVYSTFHASKSLISRSVIPGPLEYPKAPSARQNH